LKYLGGSAFFPVVAIDYNQKHAILGWVNLNIQSGFTLYR